MKIFSIFIFSLLFSITISLLCTSCQGNNSSSYTYVPPGFDPVYVVISPEIITIKSGNSQEYTVIAYNSDGFSMDVTLQSEFSIENNAGGSWIYNTYISENTGTWKVTGKYIHQVHGEEWWSDSSTLIVVE